MPRPLLPVLQVAAVTGYEVPIVALAVVALAVIVASSLAGVVTRLRRGRVASDERSSDGGRRRPLP